MHCSWTRLRSSPRSLLSRRMEGLSVSRRSCTKHKGVVQQGQLVLDQPQACRETNSQELSTTKTVLQGWARRELKQFSLPLALAAQIATARESHTTPQARQSCLALGGPQGETSSQATHRELGPPESIPSLPNPSPPADRPRERKGERSKRSSRKKPAR